MKKLLVTSWFVFPLLSLLFMHLFLCIFYYSRIVEKIRPDIHVCQSCVHVSCTTFVALQLSSSRFSPFSCSNITSFSLYHLYRNCPYILEAIIALAELGATAKDIISLFPQVCSESVNCFLSFQLNFFVRFYLQWLAFTLISIFMWSKCRVMISEKDAFLCIVGQNYILHFKSHRRVRYVYLA